MGLELKRMAAASILSAAFSLLCAAAQPSVTIEKPRGRTVTSGGWRILSTGTLSGVWGPTALPTLALTVGPGSAMAD